MWRYQDPEGTTGCCGGIGSWIVGLVVVVVAAVLVVHSDQGDVVVLDVLLSYPLNSMSFLPTNTTSFSFYVSVFSLYCVVLSYLILPVTV